MYGNPQPVDTCKGCKESFQEIVITYHSPAAGGFIWLLC